MAAPSKVAAAIQPNSTQYGDRKNLQAGVMQAMQGGSPGMGGMPGAGMGGPPMMEAAPSPTEPMGALLGEFSPEDFGNPEDPITQGLSYGPGGGPTEVQAEPISDLQSKLIAIATYAKTPHLRMQARMALRRLVRSKEVR